MIKKLTYRKTNYFLIEGKDPDLLAVDAGWPSTFFEYAREVKKAGFAVSQITWAIVTHFHPDHAGLFGEMIAAGIKCAIFENQEDTIDEMEKIILRRAKGYVTINKEKLIRLKTDKSREWLAELGIDGEVIQTPGHSDDSAALILDSGEALIGDLYPESWLMSDDRKSRESWELIRRKKGKRIFPGHALEFEI